MRVCSPYAARCNGNEGRGYQPGTSRRGSRLTHRAPWLQSRPRADARDVRASQGVLTSTPWRRAGAPDGDLTSVREGERSARAVHPAVHAAFGRGAGEVGDIRHTVYASSLVSTGGLAPSRAPVALPLVIQAPDAHVDDRSSHPACLIGGHETATLAHPRERREPAGTGHYRRRPPHGCCGRSWTSVWRAGLEQQADHLANKVCPTRSAAPTGASCRSSSGCAPGGRGRSGNAHGASHR